MEWNIAEIPAVIGRYLLMIQVTDVLDIAIMAFVMYKVFILVQSTKAASLLKGLLVFFRGTGAVLSAAPQRHQLYSQ